MSLVSPLSASAAGASGLTRVREFSAEEVARHRSPSDCWMIINNRVWDVTSFLRDHPAGPLIMQLHGGRDASTAFLDVHSESYLWSFIPHAFLGVVAGSGAVVPPQLLAASGGKGSKQVDAQTAARAVAGSEVRLKPVKRPHDESSILVMPRDVFNQVSLLLVPAHK